MSVGELIQRLYALNSSMPIAVHGVDIDIDFELYIEPVGNEFGKYRKVAHPIINGRRINITENDDAVLLREQLLLKYIRNGEPERGD